MNNTLPLQMPPSSASETPFERGLAMWTDKRSERYEARIAECSSVGDLRTLLGAIIAAGVPDQDFTVLFAQVTERRKVLLAKSTAEVWDRETG